MLRVDNCIALNGNIQLRDEEVKILVSGVYELSENSEYTPKQIHKQPQTNPARVKKLFLRIPNLECEETQKVKNLVGIFEGSTAVVLYDNSAKKYIAFDASVDISDFLIKELKLLLGEENVVYG